jgi:hypothetical protein
MGFEVPTAIMVMMSWVLEVVANVSEKHAVSIFRVEVTTQGRRQCWPRPAKPHGAKTKDNNIIVRRV